MLRIDTQQRQYTCAKVSIWIGRWNNIDSDIRVWLRTQDPSPKEKLSSTFKQFN